SVLATWKEWKEKHPKDRDPSKAFTDSAIARAEKLEICLVTVPDLYGARLMVQSENEKAKVRESLKNCKGLWRYHTVDWE
ncbi:MAG: hypothetical protein ACFFER_17785, partial [Candidatus Thorarchaeota archaeon]